MADGRINEDRSGQGAAIKVSFIALETEMEIMDREEVLFEVLYINKNIFFFLF